MSLISKQAEQWLKGRKTAGFQIWNTDTDTADSDEIFETLEEASAAMLAKYPVVEPWDGVEVPIAILEVGDEEPVMAHLRARGKQGFKAVPSEMSGACGDGDHGSCNMEHDTSEVCLCSRHTGAPASISADAYMDMSGACADGDHEDCEMSHDVSELCLCPNHASKVASKTAGVCGYCGGSGSVANGSPGMDLGPGFPYFLECPRCHGTGEGDPTIKPYTISKKAGFSDEPGAVGIFNPDEDSSHWTVTCDGRFSDDETNYDFEARVKANLSSEAGVEFDSEMSQFFAYCDSREAAERVAQACVAANPSLHVLSKKTAMNGTVRPATVKALRSWTMVGIGSGREPLKISAGDVLTGFLNEYGNFYTSDEVYAGSIGSQFEEVTTASKKQATPPWMPMPGDRVRVNNHTGEVVGQDMPGFYTIKFDDGMTVSEISRSDMKKSGTKLSKLAFEEWVQKLETEVMGRSGVFLDDLDSVPLMDWWEKGMSTSSAAARALRGSGVLAAMGQPGQSTMSGDYSKLRGYSHGPTKDVTILPNVSHCADCGKEVAYERGADMYGFGGNWSHADGSESGHFVSPRTKCDYCNNDDPATVKFRQHAWNDAVECDRCGGVWGRSIGD